MRIPEETLQLIRERVSIVDLVGRHVSLKRTGRNWKGLCPFHSEKTPSFVVNDERGTYHCFGCGTGGNAFRFLMEAEGHTFPEAVQVLAEQCGVPLELAPERPEVNREREQKAQLLEILALAARYYRHQLLEGRAGEAARSYLSQREVGAEVAEAFQLGCAPPGWDNLARYLANKGVDPGLAATAGLLAERASGGHYDRFRERLMFPIRDPAGRVVGFGGRVLGEGEPKYLNGPETSLFRKGELLYGMYEGRDALRTGDRAVLVEGYMDVISLHGHGFPTAVATLGTALTPDHVRLLRRRVDEAVLIYDGDEAGRKAAFRSLDTLLGEGFPCRGVLLPPEHDPDSLVRAGGDLTGLVASARPLMELFLEHTVTRCGRSTVEAKLAAVEEIVPVLARITDPLALDLYLELAAERIGVDPSRLRQRLDRAHRRRGKPAAAAADAAEEPADPVEQAIVERLVADPPCRAEFLASGAVEWMRPGAAREVARFVAGRPEGPSGLAADSLPAPASRLLNRVLVDESGAPPAPYAVLAAKLKLRHLKARSDKVTADLRAAEARRDCPAELALLKDKVQLDREIKACEREAAEKGR